MKREDRPTSEYPGFSIRLQLTATPLALFRSCRGFDSQKAILTAVSYTFQDGPWRDLVIRFGYDPRLDPNAR